MPNVVENDWNNICSWVTSPLNNITWDFWVHQGQPDIAGRIA